MTDLESSLKNPGLTWQNKDKHIIDVNEKDIFGKTAFYYASRENDKLEKLLLDNAETDTNIRKKAKKRKH